MPCHHLQKHSQVAVWTRTKGGGGSLIRSGGEVVDKVHKPVTSLPKHLCVQRNVMHTISFGDEVVMGHPRYH